MKTTANFVCAIIITVVAAMSRVQGVPASAPSEAGVKHYLYSIAKSNQTSMFVFDIDDGHKLVREIPIPRSAYSRGICASAVTGKLYHAYWASGKYVCGIDLLTDKVLWEKSYTPSEFDRLDISPDGKTIFGPSGEAAPDKFWRVVDAATGEETGRIAMPVRGSHNTICSLDGSRVYLGCLRNPVLLVADPVTLKLIGGVGPFTGSIRPYTINSDQSRAYCNVNGLFGFEVGDIHTGKILARAEVTRPVEWGVPKFQYAGYHPASHGIAISPDDKEIWCVDEPMHAIHIFDVTQLPPKQVASVKLPDINDTPGWVTMSIDGRFVYPSSGDVIDRATRKIVGKINEHTESMIEVDFKDGKVLRVGKQFGIGRPEYSGVAAASGELCSAESAQKQWQLNDQMITEARAGHMSEVADLLQKGAMINGCDFQGRSALMTCAQTGQVKVIELLLKNGANINQRNDNATAIRMAAKAGQLDAVKALIEAGAKWDDAGTPIVYRDIYAVTVLQAAAMAGQVEVVKYMLEKVKNVDQTNASGDTALMLAAEAGRADVVEALLAAGAKADLRDVLGLGIADLVHEKMNTAPDKRAKPQPDYARVVALLHIPDVPATQPADSPAN